MIRRAGTEHGLRSGVRPVVVGVDASPYAECATAWAAAEAEERGVPLRLIHALDFAADCPPPGLEYALSVESERAAHFGVLAQTEYRVREVHPDLALVTELAYRAPAGALVAASSEADLLVLGTRGRGGFRGLSIGSVSRAVAARSLCPVILLRSPGRLTRRSGEIVLGMEPGEPPGAVRFAFEAAERAGTVVRAVYGLGQAAPDAPAQRAIVEAMSAALEDAREGHADVPVKISVMQGHPCAALAAASRGARMTVVGAHRRHGPLSLDVGLVIEGLLGLAESPVAIVPVP